MAQIKGMKVNLKTGAKTESGTDTPIYIGVASTKPAKEGGREFPLNTPAKDFEQNADETFVLGSIGTMPPGAKKPTHSEPGKQNDPQSLSMDLDDVTQVYIRKQGNPLGTTDDPYEFNALTVELFADGTSMKFEAPKSLWLGNEFGHQALLRKV